MKNMMFFYSGQKTCVITSYSIHYTKLYDVARFEPEKCRKGDPFVIKNWWWEEGVEQTKEMTEAIEKAVSRFTSFLSATKAEMPESLKS